MRNRYFTIRLRFNFKPARPQFFASGANYRYHCNRGDSVSSLCGKAPDPHGFIAPRSVFIDLPVRVLCRGCLRSAFGSWGPDWVRAVLVRESAQHAACMAAKTVPV